MIKLHLVYNSKTLAVQKKKKPLKSRPKDFLTITTGAVVVAPNVQTVCEVNLRSVMCVENGFKIDSFYNSISLIFNNSNLRA